MLSKIYKPNSKFNTTTNLLRSGCMGLMLVGSVLSMQSYAYEVSSPYYNVENKLDYAARQALENSSLPGNLTPEQLEALREKEKQLTPNMELEQAEIDALELKVEKEGPVLLLYGGANYGRFLGCLNCMPKYRISVWNSQGPYGSAESRYSIWNSQYEFGSKVSKLSPWNRYAGTPPLVLDTNGKVYGRLTRNHLLGRVYENNFTNTLYYYNEKIAPKAQSWFESIFKTETDKSLVPITDFDQFPKPPIPKTDENTNPLDR